MNERQIILTSNEDGCYRLYDLESGKLYELTLETFAHSPAFPNVLLSIDDLMLYDGREAVAFAQAMTRYLPVSLRLEWQLVTERAEALLLIAEDRFKCGFGVPVNGDPKQVKACERSAFALYSNGREGSFPVCHQCVAEREIDDDFLVLSENLAR